MKAALVIVGLTLLAGLFIVNYQPSDGEYDMFVAKYRRNYNSVDEYAMRKNIYYKAKEFIQAENSKGQSYTLGINKFADWTLEEFRATMGYKSTTSHVKSADWGAEVPKSDKTIDWTAAGKVSRIKNQGSCGSCWAFSAVGALEGAHAIASNADVQEFSEQQLVDCSKNNNGCEGGEMYDAFTWYQENGACFEENYKYDGQDRKCRHKTCTSDSKAISSHELYETNNPTIIHEQLLKGPHSLGVAAGNPIFQYYESGEVANKKCGHALDHGVLLAGYDAGRDAWKVKNSWGSGWGEDGYIYISDDHKKGYGYCGVNMEISRPII
jgi:C1A family cysteine protease